MRWWVALWAVAAVAWVAAAGGGSGAGGDVAAAAPADEPNERFFADGSQFVAECGYVGSASVDPIVTPGVEGASHRHDFFGSRAVDADSTGPALVGTDTTCRIRDDTASYWAPSLLRDGEPVEPLGASAYYRVAPGVAPAEVEPYPLGMAVIGGDAGARAAQPTAVVGWGCGRGGVHAAPPSCEPETPLNLRVTFPDCWDGERLDSDDHRSHVAYSGDDGCPGSHPVVLPRLTLVIDYPVWGDPSGLSLASGPVESAHADFLNGWSPDALAREVSSCLTREVVCTIP